MDENTTIEGEEGTLEEPVLDEILEEPLLDPLEGDGGTLMYSLEYEPPTYELPDHDITSVAALFFAIYIIIGLVNIFNSLDKRKYI
ncbi:hypothetical protein [Anaerotalea alkaliphila]|uniref:Uncharacterized protein n=1 Tax=Anaerotalea alkaliphila TaxID=2662126 RepID=A0A7X5HW33_9FIRM|nr:hypothetical protein [Anaerotalea alkaliphila]NDL67705.1 hypothetical protein [Anaerotalea alkaliphila]